MDGAELKIVPSFTKSVVKCLCIYQIDEFQIGVGPEGSLAYADAASGRSPAVGPTKRFPVIRCRFQDDSFLPLVRKNTFLAHGYELIE